MLVTRIQILGQATGGPRGPSSWAALGTAQGRPNHQRLRLVVSWWDPTRHPRLASRGHRTVGTTAGAGSNAGAVGAAGGLRTSRPVVRSCPGLRRSVVPTSEARVGRRTSWSWQPDCSSWGASAPGFPSGDSASGRAHSCGIACAQQRQAVRATKAIAPPHTNPHHAPCNGHWHQHRHRHRQLW